MKIIDVKVVESTPECKEIRELIFDRPVKRHFLKFLGNKGRVLYHHSTHYNIEFGGAYRLKGTENDKSTKVYINNDDNIDGIIENIQDIISQYKSYNH